MMSPCTAYRVATAVLVHGDGWLCQCSGVSLYAAGGYNTLVGTCVGVLRLGPVGSRIEEQRWD